MFGKNGAWAPFIALVCLFLAAPALGVETGAEDVAQDAQARVQEQPASVQQQLDAVQEDLEERVPPLSDDEPGDAGDGAAAEAEDADDVDGGGDGPRRGGDDPRRKGAREKAHDAAALVQETAAQQADEAQRTAGDAVGLVDGTVVKPVQEAASGIQTQVQEFLAPQEAEAEQARPASQAVADGGFAIPTPLLIAGAAAATAGGLLAFWLAGSSSGVAATSELRRVLPGASPLFTRFEKDTVLGHPKRERLYAAIMQEPGITLQELCSRANLSRTAVTHHLRLLEQQHLVVSKRMGRSRHYYENGGRYGRDQKEAYAVLQNERSRDVAAFIQGHPGAIQKHICEALGIQASVAHWHVRRLQEADLVEPVRRGRTVSYFPSGALPGIGVAS